MADKGKRKLFNKKSFNPCPDGPAPAGEAITPAQTVQDKLDEGQPVNMAEGGLMNTPVINPYITYNRAQNEKVISHSNAHVIFGQDRPNTETSGYGGLGATMADTIDLVVGLAANSNPPEGPCDGMIVNRNFASDAARIYISGLTKIDTNFGIARDDGGAEIPGSAIGMKADKVRLFGCEGVKIITGHPQGVKGTPVTGPRNSKGGKYQRAPTIDLIAGNNTGGRAIIIPKPIQLAGQVFFPRWTSNYKYLQPAVMGDNLVVALGELFDIVNSLSDVALTMNLIQQAMIGVIGTNPVMVAGGQTIALSSGLAACNIQGTGPSWSQSAQLLAWEQNYINPDGGRYICSKNVRLT